MNITVEKATITDINKLVAIQKQAFERLYNIYNDNSSPYLRDEKEFESWFERGHDVYKIYANGILAGGITIFDKGNDEYYLARIYILPKLQKKGIAKTAILICEKNYPNAKRWFLDYPEDQVANKSCYKACGYTDTGSHRVINEMLTLVDAEKLINGIFPIREVYIPSALDVIQRSFATVANEFGLTRDNCPNHTSFMSIEHLTTQINSRWRMFGLYEKGKMVGYVSLSVENEYTYELHNLAVLPKYRHNGYGKLLLDYCKNFVVSDSPCTITKTCPCRVIKISIIEENTLLKNWYEANEFSHTGTKKLDNLPFTVGHMEWRN